MCFSCNFLFSFCEYAVFDFSVSCRHNRLCQSFGVQKALSQSSCTMEYLFRSGQKFYSFLQCFFHRNVHDDCLVPSF